MSRAPRVAVVLPGVLLLGALGALAWLMFGPSEERFEPDLARPSTPSASPSPQVVDPDLASMPGARSRAAIEAERAAARAAAQPTFARGESVFGFVLDGKQKPVAGATVKLLSVPVADLGRWGVPDAAPVALATSGEDGAYRVGPAPDGPLKVRAEAPGYAPTVEPVARRGTRLDLLLDRGGSLGVSVQDPAGAAAPGARVVHTGGALVTVVETDAEGKAAFPSVPTGQGSLLVVKEGFGAARVTDASVGPGETREVTVILSLPIEIRGRVTGLEDRPVAGASVTIRFPNVPSLPAVSLSSGEDGTFAQPVSAAVGEQFEIAADHPEHGAAKLWITLQDSGGGATDVAVKLGPPLPGITGRVIGPDGKGAEGVRVGYGNTGDPRPQPETTSGRDGEFELPLPSGAKAGWGFFLVAVSDRLGIGGGQVQLDAKNGTATSTVTITLSGAGRIEGHVRDAAGSPVDGALVTLAPDGGVSTRSTRSGTQWMAVQVLQDPRRVQLNALADGEGHWSIEGVPATAYRVTATFGLAAAVSPEVVVVPHAGTATVDLVLGEGGTIEGTVIDDQGRPVAGAWVQAWMRQRRQEGWYGSRNVSARSQSDGTFRLRGISSDNGWTVQAWASGYQSNQVQDVTAGSKGVDVRLVAMGWVQGVLTEDGRPYRGTFTVSVLPAAREDGGNPELADQRWTGTNAAVFNTDDGRFLVRGISAGTWVVSATTPDGGVTVQPERVQVVNGRASRDVALALGRGATLSGTLRNEETGAPIANANVSLFQRQNRNPTTPLPGAQTDAAGHFVVRGIASGTWTVTITPPSGIAWQEDVELRQGETRQVTFLERTPGKILVHVVDTDGRPLARATPNVKSVAGNLVWPSWQALQSEGLVDPRAGDGWDRAIRTDANGDNLRHHVMPGRYQVTANLAGWSPAGEAVWVEVQTRRTTEVTVVLRSAGTPADGGGK